MLLHGAEVAVAFDTRSGDNAGSLGLLQFSARFTGYADQLNAHTGILLMRGDRRQRRDCGQPRKRIRVSLAKRLHSQFPRPWRAGR